MQRATRCVRGLVRIVYHRSGRIHAGGEETSEKITFFDEATRNEQEGARTSLGGRWRVRRNRTGALYPKLRALRSSEPFRSVRRAGLSAEGLNAISVEPAYARAYRLGWRVLRPGIEGFDETEGVWLSPTWEIYECWSFIKLAELMKDTFPKFQWNRPRQHKSRAVAAICGTDGDGRTVELLLQPYFPAGDQPSPAGLRSISGTRYPDIALISSCPSGRRCFIFDAKYRTSRAAVLDAMESAHIYRDALRVDDHRVEHAVLLVPAAGGAPWLETQDFIANEKVGVIRLSDDDDTISAWLQRTIAK